MPAMMSHGSRGRFAHPSIPSVCVRMLLLVQPLPIRPPLRCSSRERECRDATPPSDGAAPQVDHRLHTRLCATEDTRRAGTSGQRRGVDLQRHKRADCQHDDDGDDNDSDRGGGGSPVGLEYTHEGDRRHSGAWRCADCRRLPRARTHCLSTRRHTYGHDDRRRCVCHHHHYRHHHYCTGTTS